MRAGQQYGMQPQPQQGKDNIAYNVEHVFKDENGREVRIVKKCSFSLQRIAQVRKMPVEIEGETIWVECVPGGAGDRQVGQFFLVGVFIASRWFSNCDSAGWWRWGDCLEHGGS